MTLNLTTNLLGSSVPNKVSAIEGSNSDRPSDLDISKDAIRKSAQDFEAAFLTQMLTFSGLGKALTTGGGEDMAAFTGFYIESLAEKITEAGGLGLAERFYQKLLQTSELEDRETPNDKHRKL